MNISDNMRIHRYFSQCGPACGVSAPRRWCLAHPTTSCTPSLLMAAERCLSIILEGRAAACCSAVTELVNPCGSPELGVTTDVFQAKINVNKKQLGWWTGNGKLTNTHGTWIIKSVLLETEIKVSSTKILNLIVLFLSTKQNDTIILDSLLALCQLIVVIVANCSLILCFYWVHLFGCFLSVKLTEIQICFQLFASLHFLKLRCHIATCYCN